MKNAPGKGNTKHALLAVVMVSLFATRPAAAHGGFASIGDERELVCVGAEVGYAADPDESVTFGAEASWVKWQGVLWWGAIGQARVDVPFEHTTVAVGIEGGALFFGGDLSVVANFGDESAVGARARGCVSLLFVGSCAGATMSTSGFAPEITMTVKVPIVLSGTPLW